MLVYVLHISLDYGTVSLLASLDMSAAFATIDHNTRLRRLQHDFGLAGTVLDRFSSSLSGRIQFLCTLYVHSLTSVPTSVSGGVPQVSVLVPISFVLYSTPRSLSLSAVIERHSIVHHSYADDSQRHNSATPGRLPDLIDSFIMAWHRRHKIGLDD